MNDQSLLEKITALVEEEHRLRDDGTAAGENAARLQAVEVQLDQLWDLLRQRRAKREFGDDPAEAKTRSAGTVEGYEN